MTGTTRTSLADAVEQAIRERRTHKVYEPAPVPPGVVRDLLELAGWAPNHHLTQPWRFRVLGPRTFARLEQAAGPSEALKLRRAPTLVVASVRVGGGDALAELEDLCAAACACYIVLLAAHARGLGSYWRTSRVLLEPAGRAAVGIPDDERVIGLLHLGRPSRRPQPPERPAAGDAVSFLE